MIKKTTLLFLSAATAFSLSGCGGGDKADELEAAADTEKADTHSGPVPETFFQVPSPGEMLSFIKMVAKKDNKNTSFLNSPANEKNYTDNKSKALNFGIYTCDFSYCSIFDIGTEALGYFKTVKTLGDQIGVSTAIQPEVLKRIEKNISSPDSLSVITDDIYFSSFETLEGSKQGSTLALVVAGGWIESVFIATNLAKYEANSPVIDRLADQKYTLENLIEFLKKHEENDANVTSVRSDFEGLLAEFNKISEKDVKTTASKNGMPNLGGNGTQLVITEENYNAVTEKVKAIRNSYTLTK